VGRCVCVAAPVRPPFNVAQCRSTNTDCPVVCCPSTTSDMDMDRPAAPRVDVDHVTVSTPTTTSSFACQLSSMKQIQRQAQPDVT